MEVTHSTELVHRRNPPHHQHIVPRTISPKPRTPIIFTISNLTPTILIASTLVPTVAVTLPIIQKNLTPTTFNPQTHINIAPMLFPRRQAAALNPLPDLCQVHKQLCEIAMAFQKGLTHKQLYREIYQMAKGLGGRNVGEKTFL